MPEKEKGDWSNSQIVKRLGLSNSLIHRYAGYLGYDRPGHGSSIRYKHADVEAMYTMSMANDDGASVRRGQLGHVLRLLADGARKVTLVKNDALTFEVTRQSLPPVDTWAREE